MARTHKCPTCQKEMSYVRDVEPQMYDRGGGRIGVPVASSIFHCAEHGYWRVYINGEVEPYEPRG